MRSSRRAAVTLAVGVAVVVAGWAGSGGAARAQQEQAVRRDAVERQEGFLREKERIAREWLDLAELYRKQVVVDETMERESLVWSERLAEARAALAKDVAGRRAAWREHLEMLKKREVIVQALQEAGKASRHELLACGYRRVEAEERLAKIDAE